MSDIKFEWPTVDDGVSVFWTGNGDNRSNCGSHSGRNTTGGNWLCSVRKGHKGWHLHGLGYAWKAEGDPPLQLEWALKRTEKQALAYAETIDNVRRALGLEATHYFIIHNQVEDVVKALKAMQKKHPRLSNGYCTGCGRHLRWLGGTTYVGDCQDDCPQEMAAKAVGNVAP